MKASKNSWFTIVLWFVSASLYNRGKGNDSIKGKFDLIVGTDIMYVQEATPALINTLSELSHDKTDIYFAYGRNR